MPWSTWIRGRCPGEHGVGEDALEHMEWGEMPRAHGVGKDALEHLVHMIPDDCLQ